MCQVLFGVYSEEYKYKSGPAGNQKTSYCQAWWNTPVIPGMQREKLEEQEIKDLLGYLECSMPAWDPGGPVSKKQNNLPTEKCNYNE